MAYRIFMRTWWRCNSAYSNGLEPSAGPKHTIGRAAIEDEARGFCRVWNANNPPGPLGRKAEYTEV